MVWGDALGDDGRFQFQADINEDVCDGLETDGGGAGFVLEVGERGGVGVEVVVLQGGKGELYGFFGADFAEEVMGGLAGEVVDLLCPVFGIDGAADVDGGFVVVFSWWEGVRI